LQPLPASNHSANVSLHANSTDSAYKGLYPRKVFLFDISLSGSLMVSIVRFSKQGQLAELFTFMESFPFVI